ncbi:hypothetical protein [Streptomyces triculaminicus]|uniref:hypothetical protein n=1 Tax=Streptomyces triculaminicus TaxID=2816232 RepID=UPI0037D1AC8E
MLGCAVPFGTVLELAGNLAHEGRGVHLALESLIPLEEAVVVSDSRDGKRRFKLVLSQDMVIELCRHTRCPSHPINWAIVRCDDHLAESSVPDLVQMAKNWGLALSDEIDRDDFTRFKDDPAADALIKAATAHGAFEAVATAFLHFCFEEPEAIDICLMGTEPSTCSTPWPASSCASITFTLRCGLALVTLGGGEVLVLPHDPP